MSVVAGRQQLAASIPAPRTSLRGRQEVSASLREMLLDPSTRLVTITGPGGVGKTRLAIHVARGIAQDDPRDVVFVPLAAIRQAPLVPLAIGNAFGMAADLGEGYQEQVIEMLRERRALVVLDNLEQIPDVGATLQLLLAACPFVTLLATSQVRLRIEEEHPFPLAPLAVPDPQSGPSSDLASADAVALFLDRAREIVPLYDPDDEELVAIARLCARLDGLPLAIELAAARVNVMSPRTMLERVDNRLEMLGQHRGDVPDRLRTMRAAIGWSYDLLECDEQRLLRLLAVFEGGISPGGATAVIGGDTGGRSVEAMLAVLVDHNLLQHETRPNGDDRYLMLESIRGFGVELLRASGDEDAARAAHARYVSAFAEEAAAHLAGPDQMRWGSRVETEFTNVRSAVEWARRAGANRELVRIVAAIAGYMRSRGDNAEVRSWLADALRHPVPDLLPQRIDALIVAGLVENDNGAQDAARHYLSQARDLAAALGDRLREGRAVMGLGVVAATRLGSLGTAEDLLRAAAHLLPADAYPVDYATVLLNLGDVMFYKGDPLQAMVYLKDGRQLALDAEHPGLAAHNAVNMGIIATDIGRYEEARGYLEEGVAWSRDVRNNRLLTAALGSLAEIAMATDDLDRAEALFTEVLELHRLDGLASRKGEALIGLSWVASERGEIRRSAGLLLEALELIEDTMNLPYLIEPDDQLLNLLALSGDMVNAARILGFIHADLARSDGGMSVFNQRVFDRAEERIRAELPPEQVDALIEEGERIPEEHLNRELQRVTRQLIGRQQPEPDMPSQMINARAVADPFGLTARERDVLGMLATGRSTGEIATILHLSPRTVATHVGNILAKMEVSSRTAAVALAAREGVIAIDMVGGDGM